MHEANAFTEGDEKIITACSQLEYCNWNVNLVVVKTEEMCTRAQKSEPRKSENGRALVASISLSHLQLPVTESSQHPLKSFRGKDIPVVNQYQLDDVGQ
ncbi:hypothetical protein PanWU01x14_291540 [Parasponia andersonii]|uniref:Uncharacterized protein n=1 Tax=Parasponia andersonii TaxID=3476 RepID=A0A2P5AXE4_PARAD|nr:hypothetical protein PanWU01x14_291540 [Parasponia andersonii]